ncbi:hypothetical protein Y032_0030g2151 [Ancylostoma ceylanicum]|uniref:Uncharacterized protein n=1 Tax=Ancylostoma ceylanicum TaxID=53326 RepID=A0A016USY7_9BILA|nr:hypothetical protein Y032_0030g2151 [Ancylostoma ceylanicum]
MKGYRIKWSALINPVIDLRGAFDEPSQCVILPDSSGTNLPTPEGWMGWLATVGIEPSIVCVRSEPLSTAPQQNCMRKATD